MPASTDATRARVLDLLDGGIAFMPFEEAVGSFPDQHLNTKAPNVEYSFWHILEHIRRTARNILDYVRDPDYGEMAWPDDYWPDRGETTDRDGWETTLQRIREDLAALRSIVADPANDLDAPVRNDGDQTGHTLLREALLVAQHNAYHVGELAVLRQVTGAWPPDHEG